MVKGTINPSEAPAAAALRELAEEAGIADAQIAGSYGASQIVPDEFWHFLHVTVPELPETWTHHCADDGGHDFEFFWTGLRAEADANWHPKFQAALRFIREAVA